MTAPDHADLQAHLAELHHAQDAALAAETDSTAPWMDGPFAVLTHRDGTPAAINPRYVAGVWVDGGVTRVTYFRADESFCVSESFQTVVATLNTAWRAGR